MSNVSTISYQEEVTCYWFRWGDDDGCFVVDMLEQNAKKQQSMGTRVDIVHG